jgi:lysophospholipase L1-like esterase
VPRLRHAWLSAFALALSSLACGSGLEQPANASNQQLPLVVASAEVPEAAIEPAPPAGPPRLPEYTAKPGDEVAPHQTIEDPSGRALRHFQHALMQLEAGSASTGRDKVRVLHLGDSTLGVDGIPHSIRTRMQQRFGDGGPGLVLLKRYSLSYKPASVSLRGGDDWTHCYIAYKCRGDGHYGIGGLIVSSAGGAATTIASLPDAATGTEFSQVELWYAASDAGGSIALEIDGELAKTIDTGVPGQLELEDRWASVAVEPGAHTVKVRASGGGKARLYGVVLEHERPGVVWDSTSMIGAFTKRLLAWDPEHIAAQVAHRDPDLIVFTYGGNDLRRIVAGSLDEDGYVAEAGAVIDLVRSGKPEASCMITAVTDHGRSGTYTVEPEHMEIMIAAQRRLAFEKGCAFFDSWTAMGGRDSLRTWLRQSPRLAEPDLKHLNHRGRELMGQWIHEALLAEYVAYRTRGIDD